MNIASEVDKSKHSDNQNITTTTTTTTAAAAASTTTTDNNNMLLGKNDLDYMVNNLLEDIVYNEEKDGDVSPINSNMNNNSEYEDASLFHQLQFGRKLEIKSEFTHPVKYIQVDEETLPLRLQVSGLPDISRVENQLKLTLKLTNTRGYKLNQRLVYLPIDSIAREKFFLKKTTNMDDKDENPLNLNFPKSFKENLLFLQAFLICKGTYVPTYVCDRCVQREQRRASRRKSGLSDNLLWCNNNNRRAIIFNNKQIFRTSKYNANEIEFDLISRIVCYCRHHKANDGFQILFIIKDSNNTVIAKTLTNSIVIQDRKPNAFKSSANLLSINEMDSNTNGIKKSNNDDLNKFSMAEVFSSNKMFCSTSASSSSSESSTNNNNNNNNNNNSNYNNTSFDYNLGLDNDSSSYSNYSSLDLKQPYPITKTNVYYNSQIFPSPTSMSETGSDIRMISENYIASSKSDRKRLRANFEMNSNNSNSSNNKPMIQKIIPAQGSVNGGIEITLLGSNFKQGQIIKFGENLALSTQCWNESTIVTYLPPASTAGQVFVTIEDRPENGISLTTPFTTPNSIQNSNTNENKVVFTYVDDTDRHLIELALQIVGLKMNGKLEDARNIAKRIVGVNTNGTNDTTNNFNTPSNLSSSSSSSHNDEMLIVNVISSFKKGSKNLNISMSDEQGRTLLHYAALKSYYSLVKILVSYGANIDKIDLFGFNSFHFACIGGNFRIIDFFSYHCNTDINLLTFNRLNGRDLLLNNHGIDYLNNRDIDTVSSLSTSSSIYNIDDSDIISQDDEPISATTENISGYETDADNEFESEEEAFKESAAQQSVNEVSLWNRMVNRFNDELLPKYEDLFPKALLDIKSSTDVATTEAAENTETDEEDDLDDDVIRGFNSFFLQQRKNFQNDKMLQFFWLPLMIFLLCLISFYRLGSTDNQAHHMINVISKYLRMGLTKVLIGNERVKTSLKVSFKNQLSNFQASRAVAGFVNT
ncbi:hypothetical protein KAFR_0C03840 [Kazachstania africana CBS 2517]|uniref:IPT/TIG domain-containing protein n=1 Tax=Kazachstania africana (strain ATCC 22294 / BCRC 22015 / CBS 2517 / CECT 1963 / NBRC 1671 / NRRL Y-8276) TaxID=1071382 RepID=H2ASM5_KAZAF|nr:hypothetical protein KAFR_0C03840 [Kazachstania africana CBS 2517]CCF57375.1 hypothetical protein KAFR_0C03840 [Kazachstania africana CBS 2517]